MLTLVTHVHTRLRIVASSETSVLVRSGERAVLWCETSEPWFLCVWKGPNNVAITKTQAHECNGNKRPGMRVTGGGRRCELDISDLETEDRGEYRCVMADKEDVVTVTKNIYLNVGVGARVEWEQGDVLYYTPGERILLTCRSTAGFPEPSLVIRSESSVTLSEESPAQESYQVLERSVSVDTENMINNTVVTCHAEQRHLSSSELLYNSSVASIRLEQVVVPVSLTECLDWWCEYQIFLFIILVTAVLILISCCGMYFFFATRGKPYNAIMYNSEHGTWSREDTVQEVKQTLMEKPVSIVKNNTSFIKQADIIRNNENLNNSLYSQVNKSKKTVAEDNKSPEPTPPPPPPVLETNFDQTNNEDSIVQRVITDFDSTNESTSFLSKDLPNSSMQDEDSRVQSPISEEEKKYLLTLTEEEMSYQNTETTLEMIWRKYRNNRSRQDLEDDELDDDFECETMLRKYALHKYQLANMKKVKRLGRTYSKVVRDHLDNNPKLTVSESAVEFEVARPSSSLSFCNRSNASTPLPPRKDVSQDSSVLLSGNLGDSQPDTRDDNKSKFLTTMMTEETHFKSSESREETILKK